MKSKDFFFLLDVWAFCRQNNVPFENVKRKDFKTWTLQW